MDAKNQAIDSEGTTPKQAQDLLSDLCEEEFSGDVGQLALALGRDAQEIESILEGKADVDEDLLMKIRGYRRSARRRFGVIRKEFVNKNSVEGIRRLSIKHNKSAAQTSVQARLNGRI